ncbi:MAG: metal ABC transporter permease [Chloroflexota bacterium]|nr:metal ABC transporter permease [Chloroflexota bacterium]
MRDLLNLLLFDYTVRTVALGCAVLGAVSGVLGCFAVLRRQSLFGDALAHAALPGVCLGFVFAGGKSPVWLLVGAAVSGWLGALAVLGVVRGSRLKEDAALGIVLTTFFGIGIVLLTRIQNTGNASQSGLNSFLFGQAAVLLQRDVLIMAGAGAMVLALVALFYKEFKLLAFDPAYGSTLGVPMGLLGVLLTGLITVAVVIGLQSVGVILMAAMLIAPASAARQWTDRLSVMIGLAAMFGALSGVLGAALSSLDARVPTGPLIVLLATAIVLFSLAFAPRRGLLWVGLQRRREGRKLAAAAVHGPGYRKAPDEPDYADHLGALGGVHRATDRDAAPNTPIKEGS